MGFADRYLQRNIRFHQLIKEQPKNNVGIIVCIPCHNEKYILKTLQALTNCDHLKYTVEVIIMINETTESSQAVKTQNQTTYNILKRWISQQKDSFLKFCVCHETLPVKFYGVGLVRKILMDEAIRRFALLNNPGGIIVSLDADTLCTANYFVEIDRYYKKKPNTKAANIFFEHPIEGKEYSDIQYDAITSYELYLRYFVNAFTWCKHPYAFQTVGSAFSVRADIYVRQGGMNNRQAGEDFYFLHKLIPLGNFGEINTTTVYPSARTSDRVPFGTGKAVETYIKNKQLLTYNPLTFHEIKKFLYTKKYFYKVSKKILRTCLNQLNDPLKSYLQEENFVEMVDEVNNNCASYYTFRKKFYKTFDIFYFIKYLNFVHQNTIEKVNISKAAKVLLKMINKWDGEENIKDLLLKFRILDRKRNV